MTNSTTSKAMMDDLERAHDLPDHLQDDDAVLEPDHEHASPEMYPRLWNMSAGMMFRGYVKAEVPERPEYVTVPMRTDHLGRHSSDATVAAIGRWNSLWESAQFRRRHFAEKDLPSELYEIADRGDYNVFFIPRTRSRYYEYASLFHLLPRTTVERYGLPLLRGGAWPFLAETSRVDACLPVDFEQRLSRAWSSAVWRHLMPGSPMRGFTTTDPIRVLAHNLDFWIPAVDAVAQEELRDRPVVDNGIDPRPVRLTNGSLLDGAVRANPRVGGELWCGELDAAEMLERTVEAADLDGKLRGILEAVRKNRVEDDFSDCWTYEREDFARKLYRKRSKIGVRFVELTDTIAVQGPETEVVDRLVLGDFLALLDERNRQIVVLLRSGHTKLTEIAALLGYSNHSAVSKRLNQIRKLAERFFDER
jgi:hypothetical protein